METPDKKKNPADEEGKEIIEEGLMHKLRENSGKQKGNYLVESVLVCAESFSSLLN